MTTPRKTTPSIKDAERTPAVLQTTGSERPLFRRTIAVLVAIFAAAFANACSDSPTAPALVATTITITPPSATLDALGATQNFQAVVHDQNGDVMNGATVQWSTQSSAVGSVSQSGLAEAEGNGSTQVIAKSGAAQANAALTVLQQVHSINKLAGDNQQGTVGSQLSLPLSVRLLDRLGNPIANRTVLFEVPPGAGSLSTSSAVTDANGVATTQWTLGTTPAPVLAVNASVGGSSVAAESFTAAALVGSPALIQKVSGDTQSAVAGSAVGVAPTVRVLDSFQNVIEGASVFFQVTGGGGSLTGTPATTNAMGIAAVGSWTLGSTPGANELTVQVTGATPVAFAATGTIVPTTLTMHAGSAQSATVATQVAIAPAVRVTGAGSVPVPGVVVTFSVTGGGGSLTGFSVITDGNGVATVGSWTLGTSAGNNTLRATAGALAPVNFSATALAGDPASVAVNGGNNQTATAGTAVAVDPSVIVRDAFANPVDGASVTFTVTGGGGSVSGSPASSNTLGVASLGSWTMGNVPGTNTLSAQVTGVAPILFTAEAILTPTTLAIHAGNAQSATVGSQLPIAPAVRVTGAGGLPVPNIIVTFSVGLGGGMANGLNVFTDANGVASVGSWTLGTSAGNNTLAANAASLTAVTITATGTAGDPTSIDVQAGNNQTGSAGVELPVDPAVILRDVFANPVAGTTVTFAVTGGGGSVSGAITVSNSAGVATVGGWTVAAGANSLSATVTGGSIAGNPVTFNATGSASQFNIELRYLTGISPSQQAAFNNAVAKWQTIITGDIPSVSFPVGAGTCGSNSPAVNEMIDDLIIFVTLEPIDGVGAVLGSAGPCWVRGAGQNHHPFIGRMRFDVADIANMEANGTLEAVILHEVGHVLGIGTLWGPSFHNLLVNPSLPSSPGVDTHFSGANAIAAFNSVGGGSYVGAKVPVENTQGGAGTRDAHWRETVMQHELMTGFISGSGTNPLSLVTVRSLQDLGYIVNTAAADPYTLPSGGALMDPTPGIHLHRDIITDPIRVIGGG